MTQQDIFRILLFVLLGSNNQLQNGEISFGSLNELIIIALLFSLACTEEPTNSQPNNQNPNTTF